MTTWTNIPDTQIDQDSPVTQPLLQGLRDNTVVTMWEEVGEIYNYAVDGAVSSFETPDYEAGWNYMLKFNGLVASNTAILYMRHYDDTNSGYGTVATILSPISNARFIYGELHIPRPRELRRAHYAVTLGGPINYTSGATGTAVITLTGPSPLYSNASSVPVDYTAQKSQIYLSAYAFNSGTVTLYRKREQRLA